jgi:hypothetical protein
MHMRANVMGHRVMPFMPRSRRRTLLSSMTFHEFPRVSLLTCLEQTHPAYQPCYVRTCAYGDSSRSVTRIYELVVIEFDENRDSVFLKTHLSLGKLHKFFVITLL